MHPLQPEPSRPVANSAEVDADDTLVRMVVAELLFAVPWAWIRYLRDYTFAAGTLGRASRIESFELRDASYRYLVLGREATRSVLLPPGGRRVVSVFSVETRTPSRDVYAQLWVVRVRPPRMFLIPGLSAGPRLARAVESICQQHPTFRVVSG
jgi:hypothetical protein